MLYKKDSILKMPSDLFYTPTCIRAVEEGYLLELRSSHLGGVES